MLRYIACFGIVLLVGAVGAAIIPREDDCGLIFECEYQDIVCIEQVFRILPHCQTQIAEQLEKRTPMINSKRHSRAKDIFLKSYMNRIG
ncbi:unnamed protein product [Auanema sp. JU1783]|nr:unnamed protein product [Auanema sp. JU1783]